MPKFLFAASYTNTGMKGLLKEGGSGRQKQIEKMIQELGGEMEAFYYAFGDTDVYVIAEVPDSSTAAAVSLAVNSSGAVQLKTVPLLTAKDLDQASRKPLTYREPGT